MTALPNPPRDSNNAKPEGVYRSPLARPTLVDVNRATTSSPAKELASSIPSTKKQVEEFDDFGAPRRSPWRQRWVDTERGWTQSIRSESSFFVHFFIASLVLCCAFVVGITLFEWAVLVVCFSMVMSAEMFQCALQRIAKAMPSSQVEMVVDTSTSNPDILQLPSVSSTSDAEIRILHSDPLSTELTRIGTAAVMTSTIGSCLAIACIFASHLLNWFKQEGMLEFSGQ